MTDQVNTTAYKTIYTQHPGLVNDYLTALATDATVYENENLYSPGDNLFEAQKYWLYYLSGSDSAGKAGLIGYFDQRAETAEDLDHISTTQELAQLLYRYQPGDYIYDYSEAQGYHLIDTVLGETPGVTEGGHLAFIRKRMDPGLATQVDVTLSQAEVRIKDRIWLAEHHLYGSSRLGMRRYPSGAFYNSWDYTGETPEIDTNLQVKQPWYSAEYNDVIQAGYGEPYGHTQTATFKTQHTLGAKGYELSNHLGNVQVVVTDKKFERDLDDDDTIDVYAPSLTAAYDYYPFGMLMPGRYTSDTAQHCTWVTQTKLIQTEQVFEPWPGWNCGICGFFKLSDNSNVNVEDPGGSDAMLVIETDDTSGYVGGAAVDVNVTPGEPMQVNVPVALINGGNFIMTASETDTATVELASTELSQAGEVFTLSFTPTQSSVQFKVINTQPGAGMIGLGEVDFAVLMPTAVNVLVRVCDESEGWRFGYTGGEKIDGISGQGNYVDLGERGLDTRLARLNGRMDPLYHKFPYQSPYVYAGNSPIKFIDKNGEFKWNSENINKYPVTKIILENAHNLYYNKALPPEVQNVLGDIDLQKVFNANFRTQFQKWSKMNKSQIDEMLTPGTGPTVNIQNTRDLQEANGYTVPPKNRYGNEVKKYISNEQKAIWVDDKVAGMMEFEVGGSTHVSGIEGGVQRTKSWGQKSFTRFVNILFHEGVHYGRFETGHGNSASDLRKENLVDSKGVPLEVGNEFEKSINQDGRDTPQYSPNDLNKH